MAVERVTLALQPALRITSYATEDAAACVSGELIGLETTGQTIEVTNCYAFKVSSILPSKEAVADTETDAEEIEDRSRREIEKYQTKMRDLLDYVDSDPEPVGLWVTNMSGEQENLLEVLYQRCLTLDPNTILLSFDIHSYHLGKMPFKAYRLADAWMAARKQLERGEIDHAAFTKAVAALTSLTPVECTIADQTAHAQALKLLCEPSIEHCTTRDLTIQEAKMELREREIARLTLEVEIANAQA